MSSTSRRHIPLTVIGGFLGSGKTTLINHLLSGLSGLRALVLVNDFGSINIDARLIAAAGGDTISLTNGCACCSIGGDLTDALIRAIDAEPAPDWIIIEASGVSDPWKIAQVGLADPALLLEGVVVLADADSIMAHAQDPRLADTILRQLAAGDIVVLNKADLVAPEALSATREWIGSRAPKAWIHTTSNAEVPLELLCGLVTAGGRSRLPRLRTESAPALAAHHPGSEAAHGFAAWTFETGRVLREERTRALLSDMPAAIIRAKGVVRVDTAPSQASVFQFAGRSRMLRPYGPWTGGASRIVFIGPAGGTAFAEIEAEVRKRLLS